MKKASFKRLKGIWDKAVGVPFKSDRELKAWRKTVWSLTEKRMRRFGNVDIPQEAFLAVLKI